MLFLMSRIGVQYSMRNKQKYATCIIFVEQLCGKIGCFIMIPIKCSSPKWERKPQIKMWTILELLFVLFWAYILFYCYQLACVGRIRHGTHRMSHVSYTCFIIAQGSVCCKWHTRKTLGLFQTWPWWQSPLTRHSRWNYGYFSGKLACHQRSPW